MDFAEKLLEVIPDWLLNSFEIMGGILPALGFAITLQAIGKKQLLPFFIIGYFMVKFSSMGVMGVAVFAVSIAMLLYLFLYRKEELS